MEKIKQMLFSGDEELRELGIVYLEVEVPGFVDWMNSCYEKVPLTLPYFNMCMEHFCKYIKEKENESREVITGHDI